MYAGRIYADFQNLDDENRVLLNTAGTRRDLTAAGIALSEGICLPLYTDDANDAGNPAPLFASGRVEYSTSANGWVAKVDWSGLRAAANDKPTALFAEALRLPEPQRVELATRLLDSLSHTAYFELIEDPMNDPEFAAELERRLQAVKDHPEALLDSEEAFRELREQLRLRYGGHPQE